MNSPNLFVVLSFAMAYYLLKIYNALDIQLNKILVKRNVVAAAVILFSVPIFSQTITTGTVTGPFCAGSKLNVPYIYSGGTPAAGNVFTAQLSDASGSFASPINIGTFTSTLTNWTVAAVIPSTITQGTGYRVRVVSSSPVVVGSPNSANITLYEIYTGNQVFVEGNGVVGGSTTIAAHETANGFDMDAFTMSSTGACTLINTTPSSGYSGASGGANIRFTGAGSFTISGINTTAYSQLGLGFGFLKNTASSDGSNLSVAVSTDGTNFTNLTFPILPVGGGTNNVWYYRVTTGTIPITANLRIRFTSSGGTTINIDDIELGDAVLPSTVSITPNSGQATCTGSPVTFTASAVANANYLWSEGTTTNTMSTSLAGNYTVQASDLFGCAVTRGPVSVTVASSFTPSVSISSSPGNTICAGSTVTFTAVPINGGSSPSFQWKVNGTNAGTNSNIFTSSSLVNGDVVTCVLTSSHTCASPATATSAGITMTVQPRPTGVISGTQTICNGSSATLSIAVTGTGPWSGTLSNGASFSGSTSPISVSVSPTTLTTYTIATLADANCTANAGGLSGSATVSITPRPTGVISGAHTICNGSSATLSIAVTGTGPWSGTLSNGAAFSGSTSPISVSVSPSSSTTYAIATLADANCTANAGDISGSALVSVNARPTGTISGTQTICIGSTVVLSIAFTGTGPWSGTLSNGASFSGSTSPISLSVSPSSSTTYTIATLVDANCTANAGDKTGSATVTIVPLPTATISGSDNICYGDASYINFFGTPNGVVTYNINSGPNQTIALDASGFASLNSGALSATAVYSLVSVTNGICTPAVSGSATLVVGNQLNATITGTTTICQGGTTTINFNGSPNAEVTYSLNGWSTTSIVLDGSGNASLMTDEMYYSSFTYSLLSITDGTCNRSISGSAIVTTTSFPEAEISGSTEICSGSSAIILFEGTPNATVTYTVNNGPNQTIVLSGAGLANINTGSLTATATYTLVSVAVGTCSDVYNTTAEVTIIGNTYFQDADGDGFGNPSVGACTYIAGYVFDNNDCDDTNANINPLTNWYADVDGDGYGSFIYITQCNNPMLANVVLLGGDCNDNNAAVNPAVAEICFNNIDDDCDGLIDEGCVPPPTNDAFSSASSVALSGIAYPAGSCYNGYLTNASVSSQGNAGNVLPAGGQDVWYKIVAPSSALRAVLNTSAFNCVLELHNAAGAQIDVENDLTGVGGESMNTTGLTVGATYYIAVRSYDGVLGAFNLCVQSLNSSYCNDGSGPRDLCAIFKAKWVGANSYTYNFIPTGATPGVPTSITSAGNIVLSAAGLSLCHNGTYDVKIDAFYNLPDGESVLMGGTTICNINILPHASVEVKAEQRCGYPATLLKGTILQGKPFVCSAQNYTFEFTELASCGGAPIGMPFFATSPGSSSTINLNSVPGILGGGHWYQVRMRPNFVFGPGNYGAARVIHVGGTAMQTNDANENTVSAQKEMENNLNANLYPNPNNGAMVNLNLYNVASDVVYVRVLDYTGKVIYSNQYRAQGNLHVQLFFEQNLANGIYLVEFVDGDKVIMSKLIVEE